MPILGIKKVIELMKDGAAPFRIKVRSDEIAVNAPARDRLLDDQRVRLLAGRGFALATVNLDHVVKFRRAEDFLMAHLTAPVPVTRVAEAAGISLRTLHVAFRKHHGVGPITWLRERRLEAAQRELFAAARDETSVTEVATRYGFFHLGRFGQQYKRAFGLTPSETLAL